jgi:CRP-like cAMP-binding protein
VTDLVVTEVSAQQMIDTFQRVPRLGAAILCAPRATRRGGPASGQHRPAQRPGAAPPIPARAQARLQLLGLGSHSGFACPLNHYLLADALGLTAIHLNRILRQLRERGLVTFREGSVVFHDLAGLRTLAEYHSGYLERAMGSEPEDRPGDSVVAASTC